MKMLVHRSLLFISLILLVCQGLFAQSKFPDTAGQKMKYKALIEMPKAYISGICVIVNDGTAIKGSIFNEFGVSAINFIYDPSKDKVKLIDVIKLMNKWYIRKVLKKDLRNLIHVLKEGKISYEDRHFKLSYSFTPIPFNDIKESENTNDTEG